MKNIIPITDLQRQAGQVVNSLAESDEPVVITQRGRVAAVLMSASRYTQIEEDLQRLDELELVEMVKAARESRRVGNTIPHAEVEKRLARKHKPATKRRLVRRAP
ncbi:MAG: type II toxin-antitoxin system Phd/YefM family antitoxin [Acidobacteriota bacterium]|nr:type II toxin-antitoxin system Phd/YefM family antitoxin [Acidobacteriota bacterium]